MRCGSWRSGPILDHQRGNQLRLGDTRGEISAQLASDHATTELNLGYLTELRQDGRAAPRGEGAELRSDEAIALHAAKSIMLSARKLLGGAGGKGGRLARDECLVLLRECGELCAALGSYTAEHNGMPRILGTRIDCSDGRTRTAPAMPMA
jgi:type VI secretion system secreted protein VgrG